MDKIEKYYPLGLSVIFTVVFYFIKIDKIENLKDIVLSIITFSSIIIGFLTTMVSILVTSNDKSIINYIKKKNRLKDLYTYLAVPIVVGLALVIICLLFLPITDKNNLNGYIRFYISCFTLLYFILSCIRAIFLVFAVIFKFVEAETDKEDEEDNDLENAFN